MITNLVGHFHKNKGKPHLSRSRPSSLPVQFNVRHPPNFSSCLKKENNSLSFLRKYSTPSSPSSSTPPTPPPPPPPPTSNEKTNQVEEEKGEEGKEEDEEGKAGGEVVAKPTKSNEEWQKEQEESERETELYYQELEQSKVLEVKRGRREESRMRRFMQGTLKKNSSTEFNPLGSTSSVHDPSLKPIRETKQMEKTKSLEQRKYEKDMENYSTNREKAQSAVEEMLRHMDSTRPILDTTLYEMYQTRLDMTNNQEKYSYLANYEEYLSRVDEYNRKIDLLYQSQSVLEGLAGLKAYFHLRRDDRVKNRLERLGRRELRNLYRDTQIAVGGNIMYRVSYHFTLPIYELQRSVQNSRKDLTRARRVSKSVLLKERDLMGTLIPLKMAQLVSYKISQKLLTKLSGRFGSRRKKAYFKQPLGRYGPRGSLYKNPQLDPEREKGVAIPAVASPPDPRSILRESLIDEPVIRDFSKVPFEQVVSSPHFHRLPMPDEVKNLKEIPSAFERWFKYLNWSRPEKPYRSYEHEIAEHIQLDPVLKERQERENEERRAKFRPSIQHNYSSRRKQELLLNWIKGAPIQEYGFDPSIVVVPQRGLYADPGGSFQEMTVKEQIQYIKSNFSTKWFYRMWRKRKKLHRPERKGHWRRFFRRKEPKRRRRRKVRVRHRPKKVYRRLIWKTIRNELDPQWQRRGFKRLFRKQYMPLFFSSMTGNFSRMYALKAICGPSLYNRTQKMKDLLIENDMVSYTKFFKASRVKIGKHVKQINGQIWFYVNCVVYVHHWIKDKYGRLMTGDTGRVEKQSWQFAIYRDPGLLLHDGTHQTAGKGMWKIGAARRRNRLKMARIHSTEQRKEWIKVLDDYGIPYDDPSVEGYDAYYKDQEFLEFAYESRPSPEEAIDFEKKIIELIRKDIEVLGVDESQLNTELEEFKRTQPNKIIDLNEQFLDRVWDREESYAEANQPAMVEKLEKAKEFAKNPIKGYQEKVREDEDKILATKVHQRMYEFFEEELEQGPSSPKK